MLKGFKEFILRGNVVDLAVAVVIGAAFATVVDGLLKGLINPLIAAIFQEPNLDSVGTFTVNNAQFSIGILLTAIINFLIVAAAIYFFVVVPVKKVMERGATQEAEVIPPDVALLAEIRDLLRTRS